MSEPPAVEFSLFDWIDRRAAPLDRIFEERLQLLEYADRAGFYGYHLAEHHATPLGMAPSPSLFLSAAAQRTRRLRLGALVFILPLYDPLRLIEEICMLDQLSGGRLDVGVGRGVSPYELGYFHRDPHESRAIFLEMLEILRAGLTSPRLTHQGKYFSYDDVPMELECRQKPYPPLWYPTSTLSSVPWAAEQGFNLMGNAPAKVLRAASDRYREVWEQHRDDPGRLNGQVARPWIGAYRMIYLAETEPRALAEARPAHRDWFRGFNQLWQAHGDAAQAGRGDFDAARRAGALLVGTPDRVRDQIAHLLEESALNYLALAFAWGSLTHEQAMNSIRLFVEEVRPAFPASAQALTTS